MPSEPDSERPQALGPGTGEPRQEISTPSAAGPPSDTRIGTPSEQPPVRWREILAILVLVVLADVTIFRGLGFAGYALFFVGAPMLLVLGAPRPKSRAGFWILTIMLIALAGKMIWCGSGPLAACGFALLVAFAMALSGLCPHVLEVAVFASQTVLAGYEGLTHYWRSADRLGPAVKRGAWLDVGLPLVAFVAFGLLFIVANPDLLTSFGETMEWLLTSLRDWIVRFAPTWQEVLFWLAVIWLAIGLLRPVVSRALFEEGSQITTIVPEEGSAPIRALLYTAFRNTLVTVIVLFAVYLVFEFATLWFRDFPEGFYYSGYAHEGAAWLTVALALATVVLSVIFRGSVLLDSRLGRLRRLAWIWSVENLLLAIAVYHRMYIYIGFNGMTRKRTIGIFGISCVVAGFLLVVWKIARNRDFIWLLRRHLWALALALYLLALWPTDMIVHNYNVRRILSGDPAPSVQISVHPINSEGVLQLLPLVECENEIIREGVRAMLADRHDQAEALARRREREDWTSYQIADRVALEGLRAARAHWAEYKDLEKRKAARERFDDYAWDWY